MSEHLKFMLPPHAGEPFAALHLAAATVPVALAPAAALLPNCIARGKGCTNRLVKALTSFLQVELTASATTFLLAGRSLPISYGAWQHAHRLSAERGHLCACVCMSAYMCVEGHAASSIARGQKAVSLPLQSDFFFFFFSLSCFLPLFSYGRVYTADPYHALAPAASYGVGAVVSEIFFLVLFLIPSTGISCSRCV